MKALVFENKVVQLSETEFPVHNSLQWMDAPEGCKENWILENSALVAPPSPPPLSYDKAREAEFPSEKELIVALWEKVVEGRPESADALQALRIAVKEKYPK